MSYDTSLLKLVQREVGVRPDGVFGDITLRAIADKLGVEPPPSTGGWPRDTYQEMEAFYGHHGDTDQHIQIIPPYQLYFDGRPLTKITVHKKIASAVIEALSVVLDHYGAQEIKMLKLDVFDGCFNDRPKRGGSSWSTHAYAAALDFYAEGNELHLDHTKAVFAKPEYRAWFDAWESVGAVSLGRELDWDWMHLQFAELP